MTDDQQQAHRADRRTRRTVSQWGRRWQMFTGWHRTEQLWREIYARTASALIAALAIYGVAAASGLVSRRPLLLLFLVALVVIAIVGVDSMVHRPMPTFGLQVARLGALIGMVLTVVFAMYLYVRGL